MKKVANVWLDYIPNSYTECHPIFLRDEIFGSINISNALLDNGSEPDPFTFYRKRGTLEDVTGRSIFRRIRNRILRFLEERRFQEFVLAKVKEEKADLVFIHFGTTAAILEPVLHRLPVPAVVIFYGSDASSALHRPSWVRKYRRMFPQLAKVIVLCEPVVDRLVAVGCARDKLLVWNIPTGVEKYPYRARQAGPVAKFVMCARFIEKKGHFVTLEAFRRLREQGRKAELTFIGYGPDKARILEETARLGLGDSVKLLDTEARGNFAHFYNSQLEGQDIFVLPSMRAANGDDEGGPALTLVCAQAAGLPVVCTPFPGAEITVKEGETGLFCLDNDPASLAERMSYLMDHPEEWNRLGRNGSVLVGREFGEVSQVNKLAELFRSLMR